MTVPIVYFTGGAARIIFSLIVLLFFPGYALLTAIFPKPGQFNLIEHLALSLGMSIGIVPVIGLLLHFSPWDLGVSSIFISTSIIILCAGALGWYRATRLSREKYPSISTRLSQGWHYCIKLPKLDKSLTVALAAVLISFLGALIYFGLTPNKGEKYTEFYVLDTQGSTENYPGEVTCGMPVQLIAGIVNHEEVPMDYRIEISIDGKLVDSVVTGILPPNKKWQETISFLPKNEGRGQKVELWLYKEGESQPYNQNSLRFYLDVNG
jgi:uncharacterized membrane protein